MGRPRRLDLLFMLVVVAAALLVSLAYLRKATECSDRGGSFVIAGRTVIECRRADGTTIPI